MRSQRSRDETTLDIAAALGLGVGVLVLGALVLWGASELVGLSEPVGNLLVWSVLALAALVVARRLLRDGPSEPRR